MRMRFIFMPHWKTHINKILWIRRSFDAKEWNLRRLKRAVRGRVTTMSPWSADHNQARAPTVWTDARTTSLKYPGPWLRANAHLHRLPVLLPVSCTVYCRRETRARRLRSRWRRLTVKHRPTLTSTSPTLSLRMSGTSGSYAAKHSGWYVQAINPMTPSAAKCPDVNNYKWWLNPVWHGMLYSCTHMATVGVESKFVVYRRYSYRWW